MPITKATLFAATALLEEEPTRVMVITKIMRGDNMLIAQAWSNRRRFRIALQGLLCLGFSVLAKYAAPVGQERVDAVPTSN
jgi:hypothetical protein